MRAVTSDMETGNPAENFLRVLDQFASLRSFSDDASAVSGYRVLTPKRKTHRAIAQAPAVAARARARIRWTGSLSVLFVGGLGLAVLAGPANCPCSTAFAVAEQSSMARLGYVQNATMVTEREFASDDAGLPTLTTAALIEPQENAVGVSPITTSALEPSRDVATVKSDDLPATGAGRLPPKIEQVADAVPATIKLAAAAIVDSDVPPTLPLIEVATPPIDDVTASEPVYRPVTKSRTVHKRMPVRAYRTPNQQALRANVNKSGVPQVARAPKWAQQMCVTPWQTRAFAYTQ
jgi:hypothetical protein